MRQENTHLYRRYLSVLFLGILMVMFIVPSIESDTSTYDTTYEHIDVENESNNIPLDETEKTFPLQSAPTLSDEIAYQINHSIDTDINHTSHVKVTPTQITTSNELDWPHWSWSSITYAIFGFEEGGSVNFPSEILLEEYQIQYTLEETFGSEFMIYYPVSGYNMPALLSVPINESSTENPLNLTYVGERLFYHESFYTSRNLTDFHVIDNTLLLSSDHSDYYCIMTFDATSGQLLNASLFLPYNTQGYENLTQVIQLIPSEYYDATSVPTIDLEYPLYFQTYNTGYTPGAAIQISWPFVMTNYCPIQNGYLFHITSVMSAFDENHRHWDVIDTSYNIGSYRNIFPFEETNLRVNLYRPSQLDIETEAKHYAELYNYSVDYITETGYRLVTDEGLLGLHINYTENILNRWDYIHQYTTTFNDTFSGQRMKYDALAIHRLNEFLNPPTIDPFFSYIYQVTQGDERRYVSYLYSERYYDGWGSLNPSDWERTEVLTHEKFIPDPFTDVPIQTIDHTERLMNWIPERKGFLKWDVSIGEHNLITIHDSSVENIWTNDSAMHREEWGSLATYRYGMPSFYQPEVLHNIQSKAIYEWGLWKPLLGRTMFGMLNLYYPLETLDQILLQLSSYLENHFTDVSYIPNTRTINATHTDETYFHVHINEEGQLQYFAYYFDETHHTELILVEPDVLPNYTAPEINFSFQTTSINKQVYLIIENMDIHNPFNVRHIDFGGTREYHVTNRRANLHAYTYDEIGNYTFTIRLKDNSNIFHTFTTTVESQYVDPPPTPPEDVPEIVSPIYTFGNLMIGLISLTVVGLSIVIFRIVIHRTPPSQRTFEPL